MLFAFPLSIAGAGLFSRTPEGDGGGQAGWLLLYTKEFFITEVKIQAKQKLDKY